MPPITTILALREAITTATTIRIGITFGKAYVYATITVPDALEMLYGWCDSTTPAQFNLSSSAFATFQGTTLYLATT